MPSKIITDQERQGIVDAYLSGMSMRDAASLYGYSPGVCSFSLDKLGIDRRSRSQASRKYDVDESFFECIDTEEKAYWLGFLSADATVRDGYFLLSLGSVDEEHIHKFRSAINSCHPVVRFDVTSTLDPNKIHPAVRIQINSCKMVSDLNSLGVVKNKSLILTPPDLEPTLQRHYWRGVVDGDGFVTSSRIRGAGALRYTIGMVGSLGMSSSFHEFISNHVSTKAEVRPHRRIFSVRYSGMSLVQDIAKLLYGESAIFLERKKNKVDELMNQSIQRKNFSSLTRLELEAKYNELGTWKKVAASYGTTNVVIARARKRLGMPIREGKWK
jgi:hypothetical protein